MNPLYGEGRDEMYKAAADKCKEIMNDPTQSFWRRLGATIRLAGILNLWQNGLQK